MIGLPSNVNWAQLTLESRKLESDTKYSDFADDWQKEIDHGIATHPRVYLQLPRGHDKTERFAWWSLLWLETTEGHRGYCCGVDRDNAKLFRDASKKLVGLHPDLFSNIVIEKHVVHSKRTGSYIETISSDANSAYGLNFDLLIINDFHAWPDKTFWEVLWTACGKKPDIRVWMESNALTLGTEGAGWVAEHRDWVAQEGTRLLNTEGNQEWFYYNPKGFLAKWQFKQVEQWRKTLHPATFNRLINNEDCSDEESYVTPEQVEACEVLPGPSLPLSSDGKRGPTVTAIDLGLKKDATAIATVAAIPTSWGTPPRLELLRLDVITGSVENPVLLAEVERVLLAHRRDYHSYPGLADPWNTQSLIQKHGWLQEWVFSAKRVSELTQLLYQSIANKQLLLYKDAGKAHQRKGSALKGNLTGLKEWNLKKELMMAVLKDMSYGQRVDHRSSSFSDRIMAVGMCVHYLLCEATLPSTKEPPKYVPKEYEISGAKLIDDWCKPQVSNSIHIGGISK